ncbi:uncharacterized protein LOC128583112 [Nycticebus coucang]|uniref:uncharacterized protein LOC128583112 n=1 Tax=Nycticebus coucang TaxID=9470 RepID=UPI00234DAFB1|nr:uncharacterized protein LOC128583112 [Nycticebus coucang]
MHWNRKIFLASLPSKDRTPWPLPGPRDRASRSICVPSPVSVPGTDVEARGRAAAGKGKPGDTIPFPNDPAVKDLAAWPGLARFAPVYQILIGAPRWEPQLWTGDTQFLALVPQSKSEQEQTNPGTERFGPVTASPQARPSSSRHPTSPPPRCWSLGSSLPAPSGLALPSCRRARRWKLQPTGTVRVETAGARGQAASIAHLWKC